MQLHVNWLSDQSDAFLPMTLRIEDGRAASLTPAQGCDPGDLYLTDGFIDSHAHVYDGATDLGIPVDDIGYKTGVHLVIDAGSAGARLAARPSSMRSIIGRKASL